MRSRRCTRADLADIVEELESGRSRSDHRDDRRGGRSRSAVGNGSRCSGEHPRIARDRESRRDHRRDGARRSGRTRSRNSRRKHPAKFSKKSRKGARTEVGELIEYEEHTAGFLMNTEYVSLPRNRDRAGCDGALKRQRGTAGNAEHDVPRRRAERLTGAVPLAGCSSRHGRVAAETSRNDTLIKRPV